MSSKLLQRAKNVMVLAKLGGSKSNDACRSAIPEGYFKLKIIQEKFQKHDCKPIFLKGGIVDQVLYRLTWGMCFVGMAGVVQLVVSLLEPH